mgnify:CR=1 FL=1
MRKNWTQQVVLPDGPSTALSYAYVIVESKVVLKNLWFNLSSIPITADPFVFVFKRMIGIVEITQVVLKLDPVVQNLHSYWTDNLFYFDLGDRLEITYDNTDEVGLFFALELEQV